MPHVKSEVSVPADLFHMSIHSILQAKYIGVNPTAQISRLIRAFLPLN